MTPDMLLLLIFVALLALGVPVAITLGTAAVSVLWLYDLAPPVLVAQNAGRCGHGRAAYYCAVAGVVFDAGQLSFVVTVAVQVVKHRGQRLS